VCFENCAVIGVDAGGGGVYIILYDLLFEFQVLKREKEREKKETVQCGWCIFVDSALLLLLYT